MNAFQFDDQGFSDSARLALASGDTADIGGIYTEFTGNARVNPAMQQVPRYKGGLVAMIGFVFHWFPPFNSWKPPNPEGAALPEFLQAGFVTAVIYVTCSCD